MRWESVRERKILDVDISAAVIGGAVEESDGRAFDSGGRTRDTRRDMSTSGLE